MISNFFHYEEIPDTDSLAPAAMLRKRREIRDGKLRLFGNRICLHRKVLEALPRHRPLQGAAQLQGRGKSGQPERGEKHGKNPVPPLLRLTDREPTVIPFEFLVV